MNLLPSQFPINEGAFCSPPVPMKLDVGLGRSVARCSIVGHESSGILSESVLDNVGEERKEGNGRGRTGGKSAFQLSLGRLGG